MNTNPWPEECPVFKWANLIVEGLGVICICEYPMIELRHVADNDMDSYVGDIRDLKPLTPSAKAMLDIAKEWYRDNLVYGSMVKK